MALLQNLHIRRLLVLAFISVVYGEFHNWSCNLGTQVDANFRGGPCPIVPECTCFDYYHRSTFVDCRNRSLSAVPPYFPNDTVYIDLSMNDITDLGNSAFVKYPILQCLNFSSNSIFSLLNDTFGKMLNLNSLDIHNCEISNVEMGTFEGLTTLEYLDMSENIDLTFANLRNISYGLSFTKIKTLRLNRIYDTLGPCNTLTKNDVEFLKHTNITEFYIDANRLATVEWAAVDYFPRTIETLSVQSNVLMLDKYIFYMFFNFPFPNLKRLLLADQGKTHFFDQFHRWVKSRHKSETSDFSKIKKRPATSCNSWELKFPGQGKTETEIIEMYDALNGITMRIPQNLSYVDVSNFKFDHVLGKLRWTTPNNLTHLLLNRNIIWKLEGPVEGIENLTYVDFSWNYCENISFNFLKNMPNLCHLNLSSNFLGQSLQFDVNGNIFQNQAKLKVLDLSNNKIRSLGSKIFRSLYELEVLNLSRNSMTDLQISFGNTNRLNYVDLSNNMLETVPRSIRDDLDRVAKSRNLTLILDGNKFRCSCNETYTDFVQWIRITKVNLGRPYHITCTFDNGTTVLFSDRNDISRVYHSLEKQCSSFLLLIFVSVAVGVLMISLIISAVVYRFRWNLRYMYYMAKFKYMGYKPVAGNCINYEYDVFVSYADEDRAFVRHEVVENLERSKGLNLLIHDRDFIAGEFVGDNIVKAITTSRKTLIVMSKDFLKSTWCMFELNMARMEAFERGDSYVCIVLKEMIPSKELPIEVMDLMKRQTYIEYPDGARLQEAFWARLCHSLTE